jgi:hypothetical protein
VQRSERHVNSAEGFFTSYLKGQGPLRKAASAGVGACVFSRSRAGLG